MQSVRSGQPAKKTGSQQSGSGQRSSVTNQSGSSASGYSQSPMVLTPVSQLDRGPRRNSRTNQPDFSSKAMTHDPEHYNPDGSLRTMHRLPAPEQSWQQAQQARYIRHSKPMDRETELSVAQIFDRKN